MQQLKVFMFVLLTLVSFIVTPITSLTGPVPTTNTVSEVTSEATTGVTDPLTTSEPETTTPLVDPTTTREEITTSTETNSSPLKTPSTTNHLPTTTSTTGAGGNIGNQSCLQLETPHDMNKNDNPFNNFTE